MPNKSELKSGTYAETVASLAVAHRAVVNGEAATSRKMVGAGLALIDALTKGAVTFDRVMGKELTALRSTGVMTKSDLAKHLNTSGTMLTKYRTVGQAVTVGVSPETVEKSDWTRFTQQAASKWAADAAATGDKATILRAIADHRPGAKPADTEAKGKATAGKGKRKPTTKVEPPKVTARTVEADAARLNRFLTAHPTAVKGERAATIVALLREAADAVEAASHKGATPVETVATEAA